MSLCSRHHFTTHQPHQTTPHNQPHQAISHTRPHHITPSHTTPHQATPHHTTSHQATPHPTKPHHITLSHTTPQAHSMMCINMSVESWLHRFIIGAKGASIRQINQQFPKVTLPPPPPLHCLFNVITKKTFFVTSFL